MAAKYLDYNGLLYFWQKLKTTFAKISDVPTATSDLTNDSDFVSDANYIHTDNNYTTAEKNKLSGISAGAEVNVQADWNVTDTASDAYIKNKPTIPDGVARSTTTPKMDGTAAIGTETKYAAGDHVHPSDTSRVPTTRKINNKALSADITLSASDVSAIPTSAKGAASGVCPLNASSKIDSTYLPSYVDDVIEAYARSGQTALSQTWLATGSASGTVIAPEAGKIYVLMADSGDYTANTQFRWGGTTYIKLADGGVTSITNAEIDTIVAS